MANSAYEYVKQFETEDRLPLCTWTVIRLDGHDFYHFTRAHSFEHPNDLRGLHLMNACATAVMLEYPDIIISYGISDEYSFIIHPYSTLYDRRKSKIISLIVSKFTAEYQHKWKDYFYTTQIIQQEHDTADSTNTTTTTTTTDTDTNAAENITASPSPNKSTSSTSATTSPAITATSNASSSTITITTPIPLTLLPTFDARAVSYPTDKHIKDYLRWRQVDCHINNLYNTTYWSLRFHQHMSAEQVHNTLNKTTSADKNEILFKNGINYNDLPNIYRKGSILIRSYQENNSKFSNNNNDNNINNTSEIERNGIITSHDVTNSSASSVPISVLSELTSSITGTETFVSNTNDSDKKIIAENGVNESLVRHKKRSVICIHEDLINDSFYTERYIGIIPYIDIEKMTLKANKKAIKQQKYSKKSNQINTKVE